MEREHPDSGLDFLGGPPHDELGAPGKRAPTSRIPGRAAAGTTPPQLMAQPAPVVHDDPFALHLEQPARAAAAPVAGRVQRKADPAATEHAPPPPPAEKQSKREKLEEGQWKFAFFFTGGRYGKHARRYLSTYCPNHEQHDARSLEDMFAILGKRVPKLEKQREKQDPLLDDMYGAPFVEEIVIVSHGTAAGSLIVPMMHGDKRIFTPWDASAVQAEIDEGMHQRFESRRRKALRGITADTRIVVRGCEIGDSRDAMVALQTMFGGKPTIFAPRHFQAFQTEKIGGPRLRTWKDAFDFLLAGGYIPAELAEESPEDQKKYIKQHFGDDVPSEFFIVSEEDHEALDAMYAADKKDGTRTSVGPEAEPYKKRVVDHTPSRQSEDWEVVEARDSDDGAYGAMNAEELVAEARKVWATYTPKDGATIMRLYAQWKRATGAELLDDHKRIDTSKLNTREPLPQIPFELSASQIEIAEADARAHPEGARTDTDEWQHTQLPFEAPDAETVRAAHDASRSVRHAEQLAGPQQPPPTQAQRTRRANRKLVGDLLAGIDANGRMGLDAVKDGEVERAGHDAETAARRVHHLLSITAMPGKVDASLKPFRDEARLALGRVSTLATKTAGLAAVPSKHLRDALSDAEISFAGAGWTWKPIGLDEKDTAGRFTRKKGTRIATGTLLMVEHRARFLQKKATPEAVLVQAQAITEELGYATAELATAVDGHDPEVIEARKQALEDEVRSCARALRTFESLAYAKGVGASSQLDAMRTAVRALHDAVDLPPESSRLQTLTATTAPEEAQFLFAIASYVESHRTGKNPDGWLPISSELDAYAGKVNVAAESLWSRDQQDLARAADVWGEARWKVHEIIARAQAHADADEGLPAAIELAQDAIAWLDHDIPRARGGELAEQRSSEAAISDPSSGYFEGVDQALGVAITDLGELWDKWMKTQIEMSDKGRLKDGPSAAYKLYKIVKSVWAGGGGIQDKLEKAKKEGLDVKTTFELVEKVIEIVTNGSKLVAQGLKAFATWKAGTYAEQSVGRLEWEAIAKGAESFSFEYGKISPGQYLGAALGAAQIVIGLIDFHDAMQRGDSRGMLAAGHDVVQGGIGLAGALLNLELAATAGIASMVFLWWATIDSMGVLGGHLAGMARNRKLRAVESLVGEAGKLAEIGRDMAGAWAAANEESHANDAWMDNEIKANLLARADHHAERVKDGIQVLHYHVTKDAPDHVGGYADLRERVGPAAEHKMTELKTFSTPGTLGYECNVIFAGIDRMARYAIAAEGPDRGSERSKARREAIDADVAAENETYGS